MSMLDSIEENRCIDLLFLFPLRCFFFGDVSSKRDPRAYLNAIFSLCDYYRKEYGWSNKSKNPTKTELPLVINTPGWVKGSLIYYYFFCGGKVGVEGGGG
jgi:polynucleotide 5'-kinase involved in rRNA processing